MWLKHYKILFIYLVFTTQQFLLVCPRGQFSATRGNNFKLVKHYGRYDIRKYSFTQRIINLWKSLPLYVVSCISVIVSRLTLINSGVVKMFITTVNVILPELETEVSVINSFLIILIIEKSQRRGLRGESLPLILRYDTICGIRTCVVVFLLLYSFHDTVIVLVAMAITAAVCLSITIFAIQTKVSRLL